MTSNHIVGIDFGTSRSAIAIHDGEEPHAIHDDAGRSVTPSVVSVVDSETPLVGREAVERASQHPEATVESIKRRLGSDGYAVELNDREYAPEQIAALILEKLKRDAEDYLGDEVEKAVITVPSQFNDRQRQATRDAGEIAGFEVERITSEHAAASMAYGLDDESDQTVLVYDLGGGTLSVAAIDMGGGVYEVVAANGDNDLGGDDWDRAIVDYLADDFESEHGVDLREDQQALQRLKDAAEEARIELSNRREAHVFLPYITATDSGPIHPDVDSGPVHLEDSITRAKFESLTSDLIERTVEPTEQALEDAGYSKGDVDEVVLVGGSTRMPQVRDRLADLFGQEPYTNVDPDEAVALGAAVQGGVLSGDVDDVVLLDVTPLSLGIEVEDGRFQRVIEKNRIIPTEESKTFTTSATDQESVRVRIFQGEHEIAAENDLLGELELTGVEPTADDPPQIEVTCRVDHRHINLSAEDRGSGNSESITIEGGDGLSDEEIERMQEEVEQHAEKDEKHRERVEARNEAESAVQRAETLLEENEEEIDADLQSDIEDAIAEVEASLADGDVETDEVEAATENLSTELQEIGKQMYQQQAQAETGSVDGAGAESVDGAGAESVDGAGAESVDGAGADGTVSEVDAETGVDRIPDPEEVASPPRRNLSYDDLTIEEELGSGGQAVVRKARVRDGPPEFVAIREQKGSERSVPREEIEQFHDRIETWANLDAQERKKRRWADYEHIVGIVDTNDSPAWVATEYVDGRSLGDRLDSEPGGLPVAEALWIGEAICRGLEVAHTRGVAHLDLKPDNVLLRETDGWAWPKIADWGLARRLATETGSMERLSTEYAAPEQFDSETFGDPDELTDIYQLGKLTYALLVGESPTPGTRTESMRATIGEEPITPPSSRRTELPTAVDEVVGLALERDKTERYRKVDTFGEALRAVRNGDRLPRAVATRLED